jgi:hypothetical protein
MNSGKLKACPFCGEGTIELIENGKIWLGTKYGNPLSYSIRHWCTPTPTGIQQNFIERRGKTEQEAINNWNRRYKETDE